MGRATSMGRVRRFIVTSEGSNRKGGSGRYGKAGVSRQVLFKCVPYVCVRSILVYLDRRKSLLNVNAKFAPLRSREWGLAQNWY